MGASTGCPAFFFFKQKTANEIMEHTNLPPGPAVGAIREALLQAQIAKQVTNVDDAKEFVRKYKM